MARTLTLPLALSAGGAFATVTHGHPAEIAQSVGLLLATRPGERRCNPGYGFTDPVFDGVTPELIDAAVADWEPRADPDVIDIAVLGAQETTTVTLSSSLTYAIAGDTNDLEA